MSTLPRRSYTIAELYAMSEEDRQRYEEELKKYQDALDMFDAAREWSIAESIAEGIERSIAENIEKGCQEGLQESVNRLMALGVPEDQARRLWGLE